MTATKVPIKTISRCLAALAGILLLAGCAGTGASRGETTYFIPPTTAVTVTPVQPPPPENSVGVSKTLPTEQVDCSNLLAYINDLTIPDGTIFAPGEPIDKRWLVENQGTCNWTFQYSLHLTGGDPMGAPIDQSLVPALAGGQAVIRIPLTAPTEPGKYRSSWQAYTPDGKPFGDPIFIVIEVIPRVMPSPLP